METVSIVGAGNAGRTLGRLLARAGYRIQAVVTAHRLTAREACRFIGAGTPEVSLSAPSRINLVAVPDDRIRAAAASARFRRDQVVFHLCGSHPSSILAAARPASLGSMHPMKSFAEPALAARTFRGTACAYEGDRRAREVLRRLILKIGGVPLAARRGAKPLVHAATVFASNYLVALMDVALELLRAAGIRDARPALALARGTLDNIERLGTSRALTGPVRRGDVQTLRLHMTALRRRDPELANLYALLARRAARLSPIQAALRGLVPARAPRRLASDRALGRHR